MNIKDDVKRLMGIGSADPVVDPIVEPEPEPVIEPEPEPELDENGDPIINDPEPIIDPDAKVDPEPDPEPDPLTELKKENSELRALLEDTLKQANAQANPDVDPEKDPAESKETGLKLNPQEYATTEIMEQIMQTGSVEAMNTLLNAVRQDAVNMVLEHVTKSIPELVTKEAGRVVSTYSAITEFYQVNPTLKPYKTFASHIYEELVAQNPGKKLMDFLEGSKDAVEAGYDLATIVREKLKMRKGVNLPPEKAPPANIRQAGGTSGSAHRGVQKEPPIATGVESEVAALKKRYGSK